MTTAECTGLFGNTELGPQQSTYPRHQCPLVGSYSVLAKLATGVTGTVYRARAADSKISLNAPQQSGGSGRYARLPSV